MDQIIKPETPKQGDEYATRDEAIYAVRHLTKTDLVKLMKIAHYFFHERLYNSEVQAGDLLYDAIVKTIDGRRTWNKNVSFIKHLDRVMESDSGHLLAHETTFSKESIPQDDGEQSNLFCDHRNRINARLDIHKILNLFHDDPIAKKILELRAQGFEAPDIQEKMKIDKGKYDTTMKRIKRKLLPFITTEAQNYETKRNQLKNGKSNSP